MKPNLGELLVLPNIPENVTAGDVFSLKLFLLIVVVLQLCSSL